MEPSRNWSLGPELGLFHARMLSMNPVVMSAVAVKLRAAAPDVRI